MLHCLLKYSSSFITTKQARICTDRVSFARLSFPWHTTCIMKQHCILPYRGNRIHSKNGFGWSAVFLIDRGGASSNLDSRPINLCCCWVAGIQRVSKCVILVCKSLHAYREAENERHLLIQFHFFVIVALGCKPLNRRVQSQRNVSLLLVFKVIMIR